MPAALMPSDCRPLVLARGLVLLVVLCVGGGGLGSPRALQADEPDTPLAPPDRSSPRATLQTFVETLDEFFERFMSEPLSAANLARNKRLASRAIGCLDLSHIAPSLVPSEGRESAVQLKEVLDRVPLPAWDEIPDAEMVTDEKLARWRLPGTEITLTPIADGPRAGEWLFTTDTVQRSDDFYQAVAKLPYRADAGSPGLHEIYVHSPGWLIPEALIHALPAWMRADLGGAVTWQWLALGLLATAALAIAAGAYRLAWRAAARPGVLPHAMALAAPLVIVAAGMLLDEIFTNQVRFTGPLLFTLKTCLQAARLAGWILFVRAVLGRLSAAVIQTRRLRPEMIDTQLLRLSFRLVTFLATAWMVIVGADSMGVSVTPLIAGLGVSGLAVALAAQHTIENFIAGLVLFADKPVRIGEFCQFGDHRGTVEQIGLRSTRIRSFDRTVISIPNSEFAKLRLVNFTRRDKILLQKQIGFRYETTADQLRHLLAGLREMLTTHPRVERESVRVRFNGYGAYSLDVEIYAFVRTSDWPTFLAVQEDLLLRVMDVVGESGCGFAFPSQTHYVTTDAGVDAEVRQRAEEQVRSLRAAGGLAVSGFLEEANNRPADDPPHRLHRPAA